MFCHSDRRTNDSVNYDFHFCFHFNIWVIYLKQFLSRNEWNRRMREETMPKWWANRVAATTSENNEIHAPRKCLTAAARTSFGASQTTENLWCRNELWHSTAEDNKKVFHCASRKLVAFKCNCATSANRNETKTAARRLLHIVEPTNWRVCLCNFNDNWNSPREINVWENDFDENFSVV